MKQRNMANRGMGLEHMVEHANVQYAQKGWAVVQKTPTSVKVFRRGSEIVSAVHDKKSTVDFVGVANGRAIAFDAKSCKATRFPLRNIESHQIEFLRKWQQQGGEAFLLIEMEAYRAIFYAPLDKLEPFLDRAKTKKTGTQSLTLDDMTQHFHPVDQGRGVVLDYLQYVSGVVRSGSADRTTGAQTVQSERFVI